MDSHAHPASQPPPPIHPMSQPCERQSYMLLVWLTRSECGRLGMLAMATATTLTSMGVMAAADAKDDNDPSGAAQFERDK